MTMRLHSVYLLILAVFVAETTGTYDICFDDLNGTFLACNPESTDITENDGVISITVDPPDATCGTPATTYRRVRDDEEYICDAADSDLSHPPRNMIDSDSASWWQSVSRTTSNRNLLVTIDIAFSKMFRLAGNVIVESNYGRPNMMVMEKSDDMGQTWRPLQYFARFCSDFSAEVDPDATFSEEDPLATICTSSYVERTSRIAAGRRVIYDLDERFGLFLGPIGLNLSMFYPNLETKMLNDLLITNLRIRLVQPYWDGTNDLDRFFYAIQDMFVVARCFCNLHAAMCQTQDGAIQCVCQHNTEGVNCERCQPLYNERPWQRGSYIPYPSGTANECLRCECNEHAESCTYNATYGRGVCNDCQHNTEGNHCEGCLSGFYPDITKNVSDVDRCIGCNCHPLGIQDGNNVCNRDLNADILPGQCQCKPLVTNLRCDSCTNGYYGLLVEPQGECKACGCDPDGTSGQSNICAQEDGQCPCKSSTTGRQCSQCADTFFNFPTGNPQGECTPCECNPGGSESLVCNKETGRCQCKEGITDDKCDSSVSGTYVPMIDTLVYEPASGDCQLTSDLWTNAEPFDGPGFAICDLSSSTANIAFENVAGGMVQVALSWPYYVAIRYTNIGSHTITGTLSLTVTGDTSNSLSALSERLNAPIDPGCTLARERMGEVSFSFAPGQSTASLSTDTKFEIDARCVYSLQLILDPVETNNGRRRRATIPENGIQIDSVVLSPSLSSADGSQKLEALTQSNNEEAVTQTYENCLQQLAILTTRDQTLAGSSCQELFFNVASDIYSATTDCGCSEIGADNPSQCASLGGQCDCKRGVGGRICDTCFPGYFRLTANGCEACDCYDPGSNTGRCDDQTGQCECKTNIHTLETLPEGASVQEITATRTCRRCLANFFGLDSGNGCSVCECNPLGSALHQCNDDGQCPCKDTVQGLKCDACKDTFYNFGPTGCSACGCSEAGSTSGNCAQDTGVCSCKNNALGDKCDTCGAGHFNLATYNPDGCQPCFCFEHSTICSPASGYELGIIKVANPSSPAELLGRKHTSYGRILTFSMTANFILDVSGETLVNIEGANGDIIHHQARDGTDILRDNATEYQVHLFEHDWHLQTDGGSVTPSPLQMYRILADISEVTFIVNSKGQEVRVSNISLEIPVANDEATEPVQFVESCDCVPDRNVQGSSCELCAVGFRRPEGEPPSSYQSCVACDCNNRGITNPPECDEVTGTCLNCRNGTIGNNCETCAGFVIGDDCDTCQTEYWGLSEAGCKACSCSSPGSTSNVCNQDTGQCDCADNVVGRTCDRCAENFYQLTGDGCIECDACYSLLKVEVEQLRTVRDYLVGNITSVQARDASFGNIEPFVDRFRTATEDTAKINSFLESTRIAETEVVTNITNLQSDLNAIQPQLTEMENSSLAEIEDKLSQLEDFTETALDQRQKLVTSATTAHTKIGALETISATLRSLADNLQAVLTFLQTLANESEADRQLLEELNHLNTTVHASNNLATSLLQRVEDANTVQQNTTSSLILLESEIITLMAKVTETHNAARSLATSSQETTTSVDRLQASLAEIQAFNIDFSQLARRTADVKDTTDSIELAVTRERDIFDDENTQYQATTEAVKDLESRTDTVGNSSADLVTRASRAEQRMLTIQENVDEIFESAESARNILEDFSATAASIAAEAEEALNQVSSVHDLSQQLINQSQLLSEQLAVLQQIASAARLASEQALQAVQPKLTQIQAVSNEAALLKDTLDNTQPGYEQRAALIESTRENAVNPANASCEEVRAGVTDFQTNLTTATESADRALITAANVTSRANGILTELRGLQRVDSAAVDRLLADIQGAEASLNADDIRVMVNELLRARESQREEIDRLTQERDDIQEKVQSLQSTLQQINPATNE